MLLSDPHTEADDETGDIQETKVKQSTNQKSKVKSNSKEQTTTTARNQKPKPNFTGLTGFPPFPAR